MKANFSTYLSSIAPELKKLVAILSESYDYVSILSTDSKGISLNISQRAKNVTSQNITTERGNVVRVYKDGLYSEYAFNVLESAEKTAEEAKRALDAQMKLLSAAGAIVYDTAKLDDSPLELFVEKEAEILPENCNVGEFIKLFTELSDEGMKTIPGVLDVMVRASGTHISKMFLTKNRDMRQSYSYVEGSIACYAPGKDGDMKFTHCGVSGCGGMEILYDLKNKLNELPKTIEDLVNSEKIVPGEYEIITHPSVTGLIAHEAFGHGVEMDMFVKNRALGKDYINKRVGSDLVTMHEGARCDESVTAFAFDDEGTLAGDVTEIDHGILKTGICDALSALRLGIAPTGNGKRENYAHKVYTRMTNTVFDSGNDKLEDMIKSIDNGYMLVGMQSGMEDPKHWGIQCIIERGYEIKNGALTGKCVSPVVMTGYVPELLGGVCMATADRVVEGNGACGKGYKEWVKVADGGPYLKTKARLG